MKLISMVDFVLEQSNANVESDLFYFLCSNYAQFLKQPLTLGMFVPCDENGDPSVVQIMSRGDKIINQQKIDKYEQARERVLFEGSFYFNKEYVFSINSVEKLMPIFNGWTIESITNYNLTLTQSALKQLGI